MAVAVHVTILFEAINMRTYQNVTKRTNTFPGIFLSLTKFRFVPFDQLSEQVQISRLVLSLCYI